MKAGNIIYRKPSECHQHPHNPRKISKEDFRRLCESIKLNGFWEHRPLALEVPTILYTDLTDEDRKELIARDNINNGETDYDVLAVDPFWQGTDFDFMGLSVPSDDEETPKGDKKPAKGKKKPSEAEGKPSDDDPEDDVDEQGTFRMKDVLFASDNAFEIPTLLLSEQGGKVEVPFTPWGANSRLRKDVATYHFYVDDYRFEALFKDPTKLILSGCKAIVEPNCSCHDQTPIAWGIQLIYKKRYLARYLQECGIKVYADLNVSHKFIEYNKMGIPKGYNAFFTRGLDGWMQSLKSDLQVAQEISGLETPNLIVYGGGDEIQDFCRKNGLLYLTDFINAKKK